MLDIFMFPHCLIKEGLNVFHVADILLCVF